MENTDPEKAVRPASAWAEMNGLQSHFCELQEGPVCARCQPVCPQHAPAAPWGSLPDEPRRSLSFSASAHLPAEARLSPLPPACSRCSRDYTLYTAMQSGEVLSVSNSWPLVWAWPSMAGAPSKVTDSPRPGFDHLSPLPALGGTAGPLGHFHIPPSLGALVSDCPPPPWSPCHLTPDGNEMPGHTGFGYSGCSAADGRLEIPALPSPTAARFWLFLLMPH